MHVYSSAKFTVERVSVRARDGSMVERDRILHPGAVVVLPVLDDGRLVLIRNDRFTVGETLLELCAGTCEPGEDPAAGAHRELKEETGYTARELELLCSFYSTPGLCTERMWLYIARGLVPGAQELEGTEQIDVELLTEAQALAAVSSGEIHDAKTLVGLLWWLRARDLAAPGR